ncbi:MAG: STAS domain-containing protein [Roseiflexaceae bacterium]
MNPAFDRAHLQQLLAWLTPIIFGFVPLYGGMAIIIGDLPTGMNAAVVFGYGMLLLVARYQFRHNHASISIGLTCGGLLAAVLVMTLLQPALYPNFAVVPLLVAAILLTYTPGPNIRRRIVPCWLVTVLITTLGVLVPSSTQLPTWLSGTLLVSSLGATAAFVLLLLWQSQQRLTGMLTQLRTAHTSLQQTHSQLAAHTEALSTALGEVEARAATQERLLEENSQQARVIRELSVPVLAISDQALIMPLVGSLDSARLMLLQEQALHTLEHTNVQRLILDITGVPIVDTQVAQGLLAVVQAARLLGVEVRLVGIRPEVAQTIVGLGLDLARMRTYRDLRTALA